MNRSIYKHSLFWILIIAFFLRFAGIFDGLPAVYNSIEQFLAKHTMKMAANKTLDPGFYIYPSLYQYFLFSLYVAYFFVGTIFGVFNDAYDFAVQYLVNPSGFYLIGRICSVILSVTSIWYLYRLVKKIANERAAIFASILFSLSFYSIHYSHYATHDTILVFFTILAITKFYYSLQNKKLSILFWAGFFSGLAIASKYNAGFISLGLILTIYFSWKNHDDKLWLRFFYGGSGILLGFLITNPYWLITPYKYWQGFRMVVEQVESHVIFYDKMNYLWELKEILRHELFIGVLFVLSIMYAIYKRNKFYLILISILLPTFFLVGSWHKKGIDYMLVCWPVFIILSALLIDDYWEKLIQKRKTIILLLIIILSPSLFFNIYQNYLKITPGTRKLASNWILQQIKPGDKIYYDKYGYDIDLIDIRRFTEYGPNARFLPNELKNRLMNYKDLRRNVQFVPSIVYNKDVLEDSVALDYQNEQSAIRWKTINEITSEGAIWVISNGDFRKRYLEVQKNISSPIQIRKNSMKKFYAELENSYELVKVFESNFWRAGPVMRIYQINGIN